MGMCIILKAHWLWCLISLTITCVQQIPDVPALCWELVHLISGKTWKLEETKLFCTVNAFLGFLINLHNCDRLS